MSQDAQAEAQESLDDLFGIEMELSLLREALQMTVQERADLAQRLWDQGRQLARHLYPEPWKPFWKSFDSFEELERWKAEQTDPRLW